MIQNKTQQMVQLIFIIFLLFNISTTFVNTAKSSTEQRLIQHLMKGYNPLSRPVLNIDDPITVTLHMKLIQIMKIDETNQEITTKFWTHQKWINQLLVWNASDWDGIDHVQVDASTIWIPDITLYNSAGNSEVGGTSLYKTAVSMYSNGTNTWFAPVLFRSTCLIHIHDFPFDIQSCHLKFGSWTFSTKGIMLKSTGFPIVSVNYINSPEWKLTYAGDRVNRLYYKGSNGIFDDYTVSFTCKRNSESYIFNMLLPCIILLVITMFSFYLPPESGERITVVSTNLLTIAIFLMTTSTVLPHNSDSIAIISIFYIVLMCESAFSLFMSYCILAVYNQSESNFPNKIPSWLHVIFLQMIGKHLGYYGGRKDSQKVKKTKRLIKRPKPKKRERKSGLGSAFQMINEHNTSMYSELISRSYSKREEQNPFCGGHGVNIGGSGENKKKTSHQVQREKPKAWKKCLQVAKRFTSFTLRYDKEDFSYDTNKLPTEDLKNILSNMYVINSHVKSKRQRNTLRRDWKVLGLILDRLFLGTFLIMVAGTVVGILTPAWVKNHDAINYID